MKFGIDTPWYDDPVERTAFNLYAMNCDQLDTIAKNIIHNFGSDAEGVEIEDIKYSFNLNDEDAEYVYDRIQEMM